MGGVRGGFGGPIQSACSGVERNEFPTRLFATTTKTLVMATVANLAFIQAWFFMSSWVQVFAHLN